MAVAGYKWYGVEAMAMLNVKIAANLKVAASAVERRAKTSMNTLKSGRLYRKPFSSVMYQASAPGETPAVRTGALQASITHWPPFRKSFTWHCYVGVPIHIDYAPYLELGTKFMEPRPFLVPALDASRKEILAILAGSKFFGPAAVYSRYGTTVPLPTKSL